jgi:hypothetical protein
VPRFDLSAFGLSAQLSKEHCMPPSAAFHTIPKSYVSKTKSQPHLSKPETSSALHGDAIGFRAAGDLRFNLLEGMEAEQ